MWRSAAAPFQHPCNAQVFQHDDAKLIHQTAAELVGNVLAAVGNPLMNPRHHLTPFRSFWRAFLGFGQAALCFRLLRRSAAAPLRIIPPEEARVGDLFTRGQRSEVLQANVNPHGALRWWQRLWVGLHAETGVPFTGAGAANGERLDSTLDGTVRNYEERA
nr:hypothetical protein [Tepidiforma sp.]